MELTTGVIVQITGHVVSELNKPTPIDKDFPPSGDVLLPAKYNSQWPKQLYRYLVKTSYDESLAAMVLGWTTRNVGSISPSHEYYDYEYGKQFEQGSMSVDESYRVWIVMPLGAANRYRKPVAVLPEQIVTGN